jgi:hypothetical protein
MDGDGVDFISVSFDFDNDGSLDEGSWVDAGNAFLALDRDGDGLITNGSEISFLDGLPGATTDLEGVRAFDTNGDNILSIEDDQFDEFLLWDDANSDGISQISELSTLSENGIESIDLAGTPNGSIVDGNIIHNDTLAYLDTQDESVDVLDVSLHYTALLPSEDQDLIEDEALTNIAPHSDDFWLL